MSNVWVVEPPRKGLDISKAAEFGDVKYFCPKGVKASYRDIRGMEEEIGVAVSHLWEEGDIFLPVGSQVKIMIAALSINDFVATPLKKLPWKVLLHNATDESYFIRVMNS